MPIIQQFIKPLRMLTAQSFHDLVAVDFHPGGTACVRLRKTGDDVSVTSIAILPPVNITSDRTKALEDSASFHLPKYLVAHYVAICIPANEAFIKLLNLPGQLDAISADEIREQIGFGGDDSRISYRVVNSPHERSETRLLAIAVPNAQAAAACAMFPAGIPAPVSIELAGLAAMTTFLHGPGKELKDETVGFLECSVLNSFLAFFSGQDLVLIRKFDFGLSTIWKKIQMELKVDRETAQAILSDGSFDISEVIKEISEPFIKQLVISKHFIERRQDCHIHKLFIAAGQELSHDFFEQIRAALDIELKYWNTFDALTLPPNILPKEYEGQQARFAAAIGAGLGIFEEAVR